MKVRLFFILSLAGLFISFSSCRKVTSAAAELLSTTDTARFIFPAPLGSVSDFEEILTAEQIRELDSIIVQFENNSDNKINIVTTKSIKPYTSLDEYSADLLKNWENDDVEVHMVMLVYSKKLNEVEITAGDELKRKLTDKECKRIAKKTIVAETEKSDYFTGLKTALIKIITEIR